MGLPYVKINGLSPWRFGEDDRRGAIDFLETIELDARNRQISVPILNEIIDQLRFMAKWLDYLIINRSTITFYGVKTKRSRMATQTG